MMIAKSIEIKFADWSNPNFCQVVVMVKTTTGIVFEKFLTVLPKSLCENHWIISGLSDVVREIMHSDIRGTNVEVKYADE